MARQSFHAVRKDSALVLSSYRSATSRMREPRALEEVSEKRAKKVSIRARADMAFVRNEDIALRNRVSLIWSFWSSVVARSTTEECRNLLACSWGETSAPLPSCSSIPPS